MSDRKIIDLSEKRVEKKEEEEDNSPHLRGPARCIYCKHTWHAVAPVGTIDGLECPSCGTFKGVIDTQCSPPVFWKCVCDNSLFYVSSDEWLVCANCGYSHSWSEIHDDG